MKNHIFEKKSEISNEKNFVAYFLSYYRTWNHQGITFYNSPQGILTLIVQKTSSFLWDLRGRWKQTFQKRAVFKWQKLWPIFPRFIEYDKPQGTINKGPQPRCKGPTGFPTNTVEVIRSIF